MFKKYRNKFNEKIHIILPVITLICLAGFIGSLIFPDTVLDTYSVNMAEQEGDTEVMLSLAEGAHIGYQMDTNGMAMRGIQIGINKKGQALEGTLHYDVYVMKDNNVQNGELVSSNIYDVSQGFDLQYVYLPYDAYEQCAGLIYIDFYMDEVKSEESAPAIMANHTLTQNTITTADSEADFTGSLKCSYIYTHKTYPFLYDFRILTFIFLAASMAVKYPKRAGKKGGKSHE